MNFPLQAYGDMIQDVHGDTIAFLLDTPFGDGPDRAKAIVALANLGYRALTEGCVACSPSVIVTNTDEQAQELAEILPLIQ